MISALEIGLIYTSTYYWIFLFVDWTVF